MPKHFEPSTLDASAFDASTFELTAAHRGARQKIKVYGPEFEQWLVQKSYSLLAPICRMGVWVVLAAMLAWDPVIYLERMWQQDAQYLYLVACQLAILSIFLAFYSATRWPWRQGKERLLLAGFLVASQLVFTWFAYVSWRLSGDLSVYAIASLTVACVFSFPGVLRRVLYAGSAAGLALAIYLGDTRPEFFSGGAVINLLVVVIICFVIDGFMMNQSRALYGRQRMVEIERARADAILYNALPASIADELKQHNTVKAEKYDHMTVMFADIVGFTEFSSSLPPDALVQVLNQIFSMFDALVDSYSVEKIKTIGDAYMVVGKDNPQGVARLALDFLKAIDTYNRRNGFDFALRVGIHLGPTVAGVIGLKRFLYDVWGDAVNTASRMESSSLAGKIQVSAAVFEALRHEFVFEDRGEIEVRGKGRMQTYFLLGQRPPP